MARTSIKLPLPLHPVGHFLVTSGPQLDRRIDTEISIETAQFTETDPNRHLSIPVRLLHPSSTSFNGNNFNKFELNSAPCSYFSVSFHPPSLSLPPPPLPRYSFFLYSFLSFLFPCVSSLLAAFVSVLIPAGICLSFSFFLVVIIIVIYYHCLFVCLFCLFFFFGLFQPQQLILATAAAAATTTTTITAAAVTTTMIIIRTRAA